MKTTFEQRAEWARLVEQAQLGGYPFNLEECSAFAEAIPALLADLEAADRWLAEAQAAKCPNLEPVIQWLDNGCDPKEAAAELRIYQQKYYRPTSSAAVEQGAVAKEADHG